MDYIKNLKVKSAFIVVSLPLFVVAVLFAIFYISNQYLKFSEMNQIGEKTYVATLISNIIHEQQKERGATAGFLNSKGKKFKNTLRSQRILTDKAQQIFNQYIQQNITLKDDKLINKFTQTMAEMPDIRKNVDTFKIASPKAIAYYTSLNRQGLNIISNIAAFSSDGQLTNSLHAYVSFLNSKEHAGIERAVGTGAFALGKFSPKALDKFKMLITTQNNYMDAFKTATTSKLFKFYQKTLQNNTNDRVNHMRNIALTMPENTDMVDAADWFDTMTIKINLLKKVEDHLSHNLIQIKNTKSSNAFIAILLSSIIAVIMIFLCASLVYIVINHIGNAFNETLTAINGLAEGNTNITIPKQSNNEFGDISQALEIFKNNKLQNDLMITNQKEIELKQREKEAQATQEISEVVEACAQGDFSQRLDTSDKEGIFLKLCEGINEIGNSAETGLNDIKNVMLSLSNGDLTHMMDGQYNGIFQEIKYAVNQTIDRLYDMVEQIKNTANTVDQTSQDLKQGSKYLKECTEEQASSVEQTASAMEEVMSTIHENSNDAAHVQGLSKTSTETAQQGGKIVERSIIAMQSIQKASFKISDIMTTIDDIAMQINLLALNAAIEASRAGDAGKGFAVVASEVRALAVKSTQASQEINHLIKESSNQVDDGVKLVDQSSDTLKNIINSFNQVSELITSMAYKSQEQTKGVEEIRKALTNIDGITQRNVQLGEKNANFSSTMNEQGRRLVELTSFFKTAS